LPNRISFQSIPHRVKHSPVIDGIVFIVGITPSKNLLAAHGIVTVERAGAIKENAKREREIMQVCVCVCVREREKEREKRERRKEKKEWGGIM
jgi:hypothetical protein